MKSTFLVLKWILNADLNVIYLVIPHIISYGDMLLTFKLLVIVCDFWEYVYWSLGQWNKEALG